MGKRTRKNRKRVITAHDLPAEAEGEDEGVPSRNGVWGRAILLAGLCVWTVLVLSTGYVQTVLRRGTSL